MLKTYAGTAPQIMNEIFPRNCAFNYKLHCRPEFGSSAINTVLYYSESLIFLGPEMWEMMPVDLKNPDSLDSCKSGIKKLVNKKYRTKSPPLSKTA